jgi:hypothetical protein
MCEVFTWLRVQNASEYEEHQLGSDEVGVLKKTVFINQKSGINFL